MRVGGRSEDGAGCMGSSDSPEIEERWDREPPPEEVEDIDVECVRTVASGIGEKAEQLMGRASVE